MTMELDSRDARQGAEAAGRSAAAAVAAAATNAAKPGAQTSEFKATMFSFGIAGALGALQSLVTLPGPWQVPAAIGVGVLGAAAAYSTSRAKIKAAALAAAAAPVVLLPP